MKTVLITGATGKLGVVISRHLAKLGWDIVLTSRDIGRCKKLEEELSFLGVKVHSIELNLLDQDSVESLSTRLANIGVKISHVVSNARSLDTLQVDEHGTASTCKFIEELAIDVIAPYRMLISLSHDKYHDLRGVVAIGSQYGEVAPNPVLYEGELSRSPVQYGVAKAALHHLTRELAVRLAPEIRVNCVAYGGFVGRTDKAFEERYSQLLPLGRMLRDEDAGGPVAFLLDDSAAAAVTGHVLMVDGGWGVW